MEKKNEEPPTNIVIAIRTSTSDDVLKFNLADFFMRLNKIRRKVAIGLNESFGRAISEELVGPRGGYVVIAGCFDYISPQIVSDIAKAISEEFETEVIIVSFDEARSEFITAKFFPGREYQKTIGNGIGKGIKRY